MATTSPQTQIVNVVWLDVNTKLGESPKPDLLPNFFAINNSLYNLFRCPVGARGPIGQPEYGVNLINLIHEPLDYITANRIRIVLIQAIQRWEPRIIVDMTRTRVDPVTESSSFQVGVFYTLVATNSNGSGQFLLTR